jgi:nucleoside-diphosphate-sugar epimerase
MALGPWRSGTRIDSMRVLVLGGTRFIGRALVFELLDAGHTVAVVHRGEHEGDLPPQVEHLPVDRRQLGAHQRELSKFAPEVVVDMAAMTAADARAGVDAFDASVKLVAVSSIDVYRACSAVDEGAVSDPVPLDEDAPLREKPSPDRDYVPPGWAYEPARYEKLEVERIYLERGATVCRLPMVYGERDYKRREEFVLRRVRAGRERIPIGPGTFLCSRGYAPEIARGLRLAAERAEGPEVFNLAERRCATVRLWVEEILAAAGHGAELVRVPEVQLPEDMGFTAEIPQPWLVDSSKAAQLLGWVHAPWRECVRRAVCWHLDHPPGPEEDDRDFAADDRALAAVL